MNYRGITLSAIAAKAYDAQLLNCIKPEIERILRKNKNRFQRNRSTISQTDYLLNRRSSSGENLEAILLFVNSSKAFDSIVRGKMEQILLAYGLLKETVIAKWSTYRVETQTSLALSLELCTVFVYNLLRLRR